MRRHTTALAGIVLLFTFTTGVSAQRVTVDLRGSAAMPTQELAGADLDMGFGFGGTVAYRLMPHLHLYGGWDWLHFGADQSFAGTNMDFEETGYTFGLRFEHPLVASSALMYRIEGAGTYKHLEIEDDGSIIGDSGHELGFELGLGVLWPLGSTWRLAPTVRYRALSNDFTIGNTTTAANLRYTGLEIGFSRKF